jgi:hypothetical protein
MPLQGKVPYRGRNAPFLNKALCMQWIDFIGFYNQLNGILSDHLRTLHSQIAYWLERRASKPEGCLIESLSLQGKNMSLCP